MKLKEVDAEIHLKTQHCLLTHNKLKLKLF